MGFIRLSLLNVTNGDFLGRDKQAVALVHLDDGPGSIAPLLSMRLAAECSRRQWRVRCLRPQFPGQDGRRDAAFPHPSRRVQQHPAAVAIQRFTCHHLGALKKQADGNCGSNIDGYWITAPDGSRGRRSIASLG